jgi:hypothetical protein
LLTLQNSPACAAGDIMATEANANANSAEHDTIIFFINRFIFFSVGDATDRRLATLCFSDMTIVITMGCRKSESVANESNEIFTREEIDARICVEKKKICQMMDMIWLKDLPVYVTCASRSIKMETRQHLPR